MKHFQDTETGMLYAFEDDYDPFTANNRNLPTTLIATIKPRPDDSHVWYQGSWIKQDDAPSGYTPPISSVPSYNPAWMFPLRPYTAVHRDVSSSLNITIEQINTNSYDGGKLADVVTTLPLGNASGIPALVSYDGYIAIPQCEDYPTNADGTSKINEVLCCLLIGGIHTEVLHSEKLEIGTLIDKRRLFAFTPSPHSYLRSNGAAIQDRLQPLMYPRVLMVDDIKAAYSQGRHVVDFVSNLSTLFLLSGYTAMIYQNNNDALNNLWITVEQLTEYLWNEKYEKNKNTFPARVKKCHTEVSKAIRSDQIWAKQRQLRLAKIITRDCHKALSQSRTKRNDLAHQGTVPDSKLIALLWSVIPEIIEAASGISLLGLKRLCVVAAEDWGIPFQTNFDDWLMLAKES